MTDAKVYMIVNFLTNLGVTREEVTVGCPKYNITPCLGEGGMKIVFSDNIAYACITCFHK